MVLEIAHIEIKDGQQVAFEQKLKEAQQVLKQAPGYLSHEFRSCFEHPNKYVLLIHWESLEAHTIGFRQSELFKKWRSLIGDFFVTVQVEHYNKLTGF